MEELYQKIVGLLVEGDDKGKIDSLVKEYNKENRTKFKTTEDGEGNVILSDGLTDVTISKVI